MLTIKTLNGIGTRSCPIPVGNSRKPATCNDEWDKVHVSRLGLREVPEKSWRCRRGAGICCLGVSHSVRRGPLIHSWMIKSWDALLVEGVFLLLAWEANSLPTLLPSIRTLPTPRPHSSRQTALWPWVDLIRILTHPLVFIAKRFCLEKCQLLEHKKQKERPGARGCARWQHQLLSRSCVFLITQLTANKTN